MMSRITEKAPRDLHGWCSFLCAEDPELCLVLLSCSVPCQQHPTSLPADSAGARSICFLFLFGSRTGKTRKTREMVQGDVEVQDESKRRFHGDGVDGQSFVAALARNRESLTLVDAPIILCHRFAQRLFCLCVPPAPDVTCCPAASAAFAAFRPLPLYISACLCPFPFPPPFSSSLPSIPSIDLPLHPQFFSFHLSILNSNHAYLHPQGQLPQGPP